MPGDEEVAPVMRVMLVSGSYPPMKCGVGDYTARLARGLAATGDVQVSVLTSDAATVGQAPGVEVIAQMPDWRARRAATALRALRAWKPDIVHIQYPTQGYSGAALANLIPLIARSVGATVVQTWHEPIRMRSLLMRQLVASEIIIVRPNLREMLSPASRWLLGRKPLHLVHSASALPVAQLSQAQRAEIRCRYLRGQGRLIVFFGFVYEHKGVELVFDVADPETDHIVIAGDVAAGDPYRARLVALAQGRWEGKVTFTGFLAAQGAAELLCVADAVLLPFREGGGEWNSSIHGATANGAYVITTSTGGQEYDAARNIAYTKVDDVDAMRAALARWQERRGGADTTDRDVWTAAVASHIRIYRVHGQRLLAAAA
jgi:glycosyltransferase involved in cell wall biosynthesis